MLSSNEFLIFALYKRNTIVLKIDTRQYKRDPLYFYYV